MSGKNDVDILRICLVEAERGDAQAQNKLGDIYRLVQVVDRDLVVANHWYRLAAEQGYVAAQYNLALMYRFGLGVKSCKEEAFKLYELAMEQGRNAVELNKKKASHYSFF